MNDKKTDTTPFLWLLAILAVCGLIGAGFAFMGGQRQHNGMVWRWLRPVVLQSPAQTAVPVDVKDHRRVAYVVVQTEKGLYFLSGTDFVPQKGASVVVQANEQWELWLCAADGGLCSPIHSFCAGMAWPMPEREADGSLPGCHAPHTGRPLPTPAADEKPPVEAIPGGMGKRKRTPPPAGISHPREWAHLMGLPTTR